MLLKKLLRWLEDVLLTALIRRLPLEGTSAKVFTEIAKKFVLVTINLVVLRFETGRLQVLLLQRSKHDPCWPNEWHIPGTVLRRTDFPGVPIGSDYPILRIEQVELKAKLKNPPILVGEMYLPATRRGAELTKFFLGELEDNKIVQGKFFSLDDLPGEVGFPEEALVLRAARQFVWMKHFF